MNQTRADRVFPSFGPSLSAALQDLVSGLPNKATLAPFAFKRMRSSQARVARIEGADASVTADLMLQALIATGPIAKKLIRPCSYEVRRGSVTVARILMRTWPL